MTLKMEIRNSIKTYTPSLFLIIRKLKHKFIELKKILYFYGISMANMNAKAAYALTYFHQDKNSDKIISELPIDNLVKLVLSSPDAVKYFIAGYLSLKGEGEWDAKYEFCSKMLSKYPRIWFNLKSKILISDAYYMVRKSEMLGNDLQLYVSPDKHIFNLPAEPTKNPAIFYPSLPKSATESIHTHLHFLLKSTHMSTTTGAFPDFTDYLIPAVVKEFAKGGTVSGDHTYASSHNLAILQECGIKKVLVNIRDPRQALLSLIHHFDRYYLDATEAWSDSVIVALFDGYEKLSFDEKIEWNITNKFLIITGWIEQWVHAQEHSELDIKFTRYEDYAADKENFFINILQFYNLDIDSFESVEMPKIHFRKGESDEWRKVFSYDQQERLWAMMPDAVKVICEAKK